LEILATETFFVPKEVRALLVYCTNYDQGPSNLKGKNFGATPTMKDDFKLMYNFLVKLGID
jgi:hypothetical protein